MSAAQPAVAHGRPPPSLRSVVRSLLNGSIVGHTGGHVQVRAADTDLNLEYGKQTSVAAARPALRWLLRVHALVTAAAGSVLVVAPAAIPGVVGIRLGAGAELLCYLLAGAEFGFAALSWYGAAARDPHTIRAVVRACLVLHATSLALEALAIVRGADARLWYNVAGRIAIIAAFGAFARTAPMARGRAGA